MIALIQRVNQAQVTIGNGIVGRIDHGLVIFLGVEQSDDQEKAQKLCDKVLGYRIFSDEQGKMNLNVQQAMGSLLVVSQFTLVADTHKGMRPSFSKGASPAHAEAMYHHFVDLCRQQDITTETGKFAHDMQVSLTNDGPVTFWLQV